MTVEAAEDQMVSGSSSIAPSSEFTVTMSSTGNTSPGFYKNPTATVQEDGTWNVTSDFSDQSEGDTFSVSADSDFQNAIDADGEVGGAATAEPTETAEPTDESTTTSTSTPGFGVAVALVALLAAALLAGRRE